MGFAASRAAVPCGECRRRPSRVDVMTKAERLPSVDAVEAAIARVLDAEHTARDAVRDAEEEAAAMTEATRATARAVALSTERRIRAVRAAFEARAAAEVAALRTAAEAADAAHELTPAELARLDVAVTSLAALLTGAGPR